MKELAGYDIELFTITPYLVKKWFTYSEYKDSSIEWLGDIPTHWKVERLKHSVTTCQNGIWGDEPAHSEDDIPCVRVADFDRVRRRIFDTNLTLRSIPANQRQGRLLKRGDLLLEKSGGGELQPVGTVIFYNLDYQAVCSNFIARMTVSQDFDSSFLCYLHFTLYEARINTLSIKQNTGIQNLDSSAYLNERIGIPPLTEQHAIVSFLDRETAKIDALMAKKEQLIQLLQEKRSALISRAITRGLNPAVPMKDSGVEWLGEIPEHWKIIQLRRIVNTFVDYRGFTPIKTPDGIPLITARNVKNGVIDFTYSQEFISEEAYPDRMVRGFPAIGDVLITTEAPLGEAAQITDERVALAQRIILLKIDKLLITNEYLKYYILSLAGQGELWSRATGSTAVGIKASHLREILVTVPSLPEQLALTIHLDQETARIDSLIARIREGIKKLQEYRTALISAAVTGKIDVREERTTFDVVGDVSD